MPGPPKPEGGLPAVFDMPTLGRAVRLGELYDQRSGKFLGVQLYPRGKAQDPRTYVRHTDISLTPSNTHEQRASLLDVNAHLSLHVLSGLVKASGSASYLNDKKSNIREYAYAIALKVRLFEERILFTEIGLGHNVLPDAREDYVETRLATHSVSSIVYGGNVIINLIARQSELSDGEKVEGQLRAQLDKLKDAISLQGSADARTKGEFSNLNDKFDLVVHGDLILSKVPRNPQDILDTFPEAVSLIVDRAGVPISVTLQPIPPKICTGGFIHQLDAGSVDDILKIFSALDDLANRFSILQDHVSSLQDFIPELARTTRVAAAAYAKDHNKLRYKLRKFMREYPQGNLDSDHSSGITEDEVFNKAVELHEKHLSPDQNDTEAPGRYPSTLAGLENELSQFQYFASDVQRMRKSLQPFTPTAATDIATKSPFYLSNIEGICRATRLQSRIPLFIMTPLTGARFSSDSTITKYFALLRRHIALFENSANPAYMLYAENLDDLERRLPSGGRFSGLKVPTLFFGEVDDSGDLTWFSLPAPDRSDLTFQLNHKSARDSIGRLSLSLDPVDGTKAFSIQIWATKRDISSEFATALRLYCITPQQTYTFLSFRLSPFEVLHEACSVRIGSQAGRHPRQGDLFMGTFVQDIQNKQWIAYFNDCDVGRHDFSENDLRPALQKLEIAYEDSEKWWGGEVHQVKAFTRALTSEEVKAQYLAGKT